MLLNIYCKIELTRNTILHKLLLIRNTRHKNAPRTQKITSHWNCSIQISQLYIWIITRYLFVAARTYNKKKPPAPWQANRWLSLINKYIIPKHIKMSDKNCFFFPSSLFKNNYIATAIKEFQGRPDMNVLLKYRKQNAHLFGWYNRGLS